MQAPKRIVDEIGRLYNGLLKRPINESQLARPTFKLIHELVRQLMTECRILRDVFTQQDLEPSRLKDRKAKLNFLDKLIEYAASNRQPVIGCVAARILDAQEPGKTLELLQSLLYIAQERLSPASSNSNSRLNRTRTFTTKPIRRTPAKSSPKRSKEPLEKPQVSEFKPNVTEKNVDKPVTRESVKEALELEEQNKEQLVDVHISPVRFLTDDNLSRAIPQFRQALKNIHQSLLRGIEARELVFERCQKELSSQSSGVSV